MQLHWLKKEAEQSRESLADKKLIIFFCGWGIDERAISHLQGDEYDVLVLKDYRSLAFYFSIYESVFFDCYSERILVAWSFGVAAASKWLSKGLDFKFDKKIAINGSMQAVNRYLGIPEVVMQKTIDTLSQQSFELFTKRCYGKQPIPFDVIEIDVDVRKQELEAVQNQSFTEVDGWDIAWIGTQDKIFPKANLSRAWQEYNSKQDSQSQADIRFIEAPHAPFSLWTHWQDIIS